MREIITPDKQKARALFLMADELFRRVNSISLLSFPSPNLSDLYDVIHMRLDGLLIQKGIKFKGEGAHFELIQEAGEQGLLSESEIVFVQRLRTIRNRHKYEGFSIEPEFLERNKNKIFKIIEKLKSYAG